MPIVWSKKLGDEGVIAIWEISESADELYNQLQLNQNEKNYYESLHKGKRHMHWLGSRVLLRTLLDTNLYIDCQLDENNKPYLVNFPYEISITHSNEMAAVIIYKNKKVGLDIEKISAKIQRIKHRFLSTDELAFIKPDFENEQLYVCWGIKESLFKLYGKGNLPFIKGIKIKPFDYLSLKKIKAEINTNEYQQQYEINYFKFNEFMLTWVIE